MNIKSVRREIIRSYSIDGFINYFRIAREDFKLNVKLSSTGMSRLKSMIDCAGIDRNYIVKNYGICDYNARQVLSFRNRTPLLLVLDVITKFHAKQGSGAEDIRKDARFFLENVCVFSCRGSFDTELPKSFSVDLLYLTGLIMGDGSMAIKYNRDGRQYEIYIEKANYPFIRGVVAPLFRALFHIKNIKIRRNPVNRGSVRYRVFFKSRIVYDVLENVLGVPAGKKSYVVKFPYVLKELPFAYKMALFAGLVDTDWGRIRWNRFGTHMSSEGLSKDYIGLFKEMGIKLKVKKYVQRERFVSYQCFMNRGDEAKLIEALNRYYPLKNTKRIKTIEAGMAEWLMHTP